MPRGMKPYWLAKRHERLKAQGKKTRRTLMDITERLSPKEIYEKITTTNIPVERAKRYGVLYKTAKRYYRCRDQALMSLIFLCVARINEVLRLKTRQFDLTSDPDFILIRNFYVSKRKEKTIKRYGLKLLDIPIPKRKKASLYPFTDLVLAYLQICRGPKLFRFGTGRAWQIVKGVTGEWPHWFRSQSLSFHVNLIGSDTAVAKMYGIENVQTISWYFKGEWKDHREPLMR